MTSRVINAIKYSLGIPIIRAQTAHRNRRCNLCIISKARCDKYVSNGSYFANHFYAQILAYATRIWDVR